jgi:hypothetical protein
MRVFISAGMTGRSEEDVLDDIQKATDWIHEEIDKNAEIVHTYFQEEAPADAGPTWYLGKSIQVLGTCDLCCFVGDWEMYRGCVAELHICEIYGIDRTYFVR